LLVVVGFGVHGGEGLLVRRALEGAARPRCDPGYQGFETLHALAAHEERAASGRALRGMWKLVLFAGLSLSHPRHISCCVLDHDIPDAQRSTVFFGSQSSRVDAAPARPMSPAVDEHRADLVGPRYGRIEHTRPPAESGRTSRNTPGSTHTRGCAPIPHIPAVSRARTRIPNRLVRRVSQAHPESLGACYRRVRCARRNF
jgi:hypothetical protein